MIEEKKKIYRRSTLLPAKERGKGERGQRIRNTILNFRVTPEDKELIANRVELSGLSKQDFLTQSCLHQKIVMQANIKSLSAIKREVKSIDEHLCSVLEKGESIEQMDLKKLESLRTILEILDSVYNEENAHE